MPDAYILGIPFAASPYPMWVYDRETRVFLEVNDAAVAAYGFSRAEFMEEQVDNDAIDPTKIVDACARPKMKE